MENYPTLIRIPQVVPIAAALPILAEKAIDCAILHGPFVPENTLKIRRVVKFHNFSRTNLTNSWTFG